MKKPKPCICPHCGKDVGSIENACDITQAGRCPNMENIQIQ